MKKLLFSSLLVLASGFFFASEASAQASAGIVVYCDGEVTSNGRVIDTGDRLTGPVTLKTGPRSELEVVFDDRNVFRLGSNTVVRVDFAALRKTVNLDQGAFTSVLKKLAQATGSPSFVLKTPTAQGGVRGTSFHAGTDGSRTYFCTCNGKVELAGGPHEEVLTNAHHGSRVFTRGSDGTVTMETGGLEGHSDSSIETLARKISAVVDWTVPDLKHD